MANLFNDDFIDFLRAFNNQKVEHLLVGGYAVILHGYTRSTADMDVWVKRTSENYHRIKKAFIEFGAPIFSEIDFLGDSKDVWALGREPSKIEIMSQVKGLDFSESLALCNKVKLEDFEVPYIHLNHLIKAKQAAGRFKDLADIEQLMKKNKKQ